MSDFRNLQKLEAIEDREGFYTTRTHCDLCGKQEVIHYHELISRAMTQGNPEARELSFDKHLCSLLCQRCHDVAETQTVDKMLWQHNISLYGKETVEVALKKVQAVMKTKVEINE